MNRALALLCLAAAAAGPAACSREDGPAPAREAPTPEVPGAAPPPATAAPAGSEERLERIEKKLDALRGDLEDLAREAGAQGDELKRLTRAVGEHGQHLADLKRHIDVALRRLEPGGGGAAPPDPEDIAALKTRLVEQGVVLDEKARTVTVSGVANMERGPIELLACARRGRAHEALFVLDCEPSAVNAGLIALGLAPGTPARFEEGGKVIPPQGPPVYITVEWDLEGARHRHRAEDLVLNRLTDAPMRRIGWVYLGSRMENHYQTGRPFFVADVTRDVVTTWFEANSILDNPLPEGADDTVFFAHPERMPPRGTPVRMVLSLQETP